MSEDVDRPDGRCEACRYWRRPDDARRYATRDPYRDAVGTLWSECLRVNSVEQKTDARMSIDAADDCDIRMETAADFGCVEFSPRP